LLFLEFFFCLREYAATKVRLTYTRVRKKFRVGRIILVDKLFDDELKFLPKSEDHAFRLRRELYAIFRRFLRDIVNLDVIEG